MSKLMNMAMNGYHIQVSPDTPKMQLSEGCPVTPEFRIEMNEWMKNFFGMQNLIPDGECYIMEIMKIIQMNPRTYAQLLAAVDKQGLIIPKQEEIPMLL